MGNFIICNPNLKTNKQTKTPNNLTIRTCTINDLTLSSVFEWMLSAPGLVSRAFAFLWRHLHGSPSLSRDGGYSPPSTFCDLSQQLLLLYMLQFLSLLGNGNKSPNCRLKAKYYLKQSHIRGSVSIKPAEYTVCIYCVSIKLSPPQIWQVPWFFFTDPLQSVSFFHFM